jgi:pimeloyl-ACP methyl ester carboxylesterase
MSLSAAITMLRLLYSVNARSHAARPEVRESELPLSGTNPAASLYEPLRRPRRTLVLVHGVTGRANADPLLVHLARSLGSLGYRCVVPALQQLSRFRHDPRDIQTVVDTIAACQELEADAVAVLAFSYGASYALCAAADPRVRDSCAALVGFGAYYQLSEALEHQRQLLLQHPDLEHDDADIAYLRYTLLACHRDQLQLSAEAWQAIDPILVAFTTPLPIEQRRAPLLRYARHVDYVGLMQAYQQRELSSRLSPADSLCDVRCSVGLLHDPNDRFVPKSHVERLRAGLDARPGCVPTEVLTTPMLSHVQVDPLRRLFDLPKLIRLLEPVLGE